MSYSDTFKNYMKESALIGGVAFGATVIGLDGMIAQALGSTGVMSSISSPGIRMGIVTFGVVFSADMIYHMFLQDWLNKSA